MARGRLSRRLRALRPLLLTVAAIGVVLVSAWMLLRTTLLRNAYDTGTVLSRSFAEEVSGRLAAYETLLSFGAASLDLRLTDPQATWEDTLEWAQLYFQRVEQMMGEGALDPYAVIDGEIVAANPWEGDATYDVQSAPWYRLAQENPGKVVATGVYEDAVYRRPVVTLSQLCPESGAVMAFDILLERYPLGEGQLKEGDSVFLCDGEGQVITCSTDVPPELDLSGYLSGLIRRFEQGELQRYDAAVRDLEGKRRGVYYTRLENGWYVIVTLSYQNILGELHWFLGVFAAAALAGVLLAGWAVLREARLRRRVVRADETSRALGNSYYALYRVDFARETYEMIKGSDYVRQRLPEKGPYQQLLDVAMEVIEPEVKEEFLRSFSCQNIRRLVSQKTRDFGGDFLRLFGEEYRWVSVRVLFDESLSPQEAVLSFREVEEEKQRQLQQRRLLEDSLHLARQNEAAKQAFFSNMSHDMRTPINAILGLTQVARQHPGDQAQTARCLDRIDSSGKFLLGLINDVLDMSRMEQGKLTLDARAFSLRECLEDCLEGFRPQARQQGKALVEEIRCGDEALLGDDFRLRQILNNLLSNALKFTPEGGRVSLSVERVSAGEVAQYRFVVADTGIGMSPSFLKRLYEPYAREMRFSAHQAAGTGLGMAITKSLVSQMEGEIQVESEPGKGTTFTVTLPFAPAQQDAAPVSASAPAAQDALPLEGLRVLLAEDNELNREIAQELLAARGMEVTPAADGQEAVALFANSQPFSFGAVLLDMQMPVMDGCQAARTIRAMDRPDAKTVPIVAVTANAFAEDIAATAAAGMDAHISKPIDYAALERTLQSLCSRSPR